MSSYLGDISEDRPSMEGLHAVSFRTPADLRQTIGDVDADMTTEYVNSTKRPSIISPYGDRRLTTRTSVKVSTAKLEDRRQTIAKRATQTGKAPGRRTTVMVDNTKDVTLDGADIFKNYKIKPANTVFRWNLLWLAIAILSFFPLWSIHINCAKTIEAQFIMNGILQLNYLYATFLCFRYMWKMIRSFNTSYYDELDPEVRDKIQHIVVMPTYKEPVELLIETMSSVSNQTIAHQIIFVVGMEQKTPLQAEKKRKIRERFGTAFKALVFAVHPSGVPGEIPGACSNRNYAARAAVKYMIMKGLLEVDPATKEVELDFTTCTVCDADTTFYYRYFENLSWCFLNEPPETRYTVCFQSPLFYNITLDERWFFTRAMGIIRSYFMVGFLIGGDINTMSIYSMSLRLLVEGQFFHPGYQMDDIIYTLSAMRATGDRIRIRTIDIPTLSGPTSGTSMIHEFKEWWVQAERWTIGAAEVFHYFFVKLLKGNYFLPGLAYFWWFVYYYGFILCVMGIMNMCGIVNAFISIKHKEIDPNNCKPFSTWGDFPEDWQWYGFWFGAPFGLIFFYVVVVLPAFMMDALVAQILALDENVNPVRNLLHFISAQPVLWMYNICEFYSIVKVAIYGKAVCGHKASEKHALAGKKEADKDDLAEPLVTPV
mmetsp:Transcript_1855/g.4235  ORF Transcript_1855/g.4235 Transcript_1855/m.4235 type:complete len:654 (+) Transcript_1855:98-2059(+)